MESKTNSNDQVRLVLKQRQSFDLESLPVEDAAPCDEGYTRLKTLYCAICRTDAKMWNEGHRELVFPRVPGHEIAAYDEEGRRFAVWPGKSCGICRFCKKGRSNLCSSMKIIGFHTDGGFAAYVDVPTSSVVPLGDEVQSRLAVFAEPLGCVLNAFGALMPRPGESMIIFGGGTLGLLSALVAKSMGVDPTVIEKSEEKIQRARAFIDLAEIRCEKQTLQSSFDMAINACADPVALSLAITKLEKGGRLSFFSGVHKNKGIETNLFNLAHYRELAILGAYGLTKKNMEDALPLISKYGTALELLIEEVIPIDAVESVMHNVLQGKSLKYVVEPIVSSRGILNRTASVHAGGLANKKKIDNKGKKTMEAINRTGNQAIDEVAAKIAKVDESLRPAAQHKIDNKTKPLGALGMLEDLGVKIAVAQGDLNPELNRKVMFVFAGDHGIADEGVSAFPAEVTGQMVLNFLSGGAAINVLCRHQGIDMHVVDMGVKADFDDHSSLINKKVRRGTRNFAIEPAMTRDEAVTAINNGMDVFFTEHKKSKISIIGAGEMGIANTTSAAAIICAVTGISPEDAAGRGTGIDDKGLDHKIEVLQKVLDLHKPDTKDGLDILKKVGGFEIAGIVGAVLAAASQKSIVVLDGVISTAAGLIASLINPNVEGYLISGHKSIEKAQAAALSHMGLVPVLDFSMRLGEGTGAAMTIDVADAACRIMREMASFEDAGVSNRD